MNGDETAAPSPSPQCNELVSLTDVEGVKNGDGEVIERSGNPGELLSASFVNGGMIPSSAL